MSALDYGKSALTPLKQECLERLLAKQLGIIAYGGKRDNYTPIFHYIDLYAGPGIDADGDAGSPVIFLRTAQRFPVQVRSWFIEQDWHTVHALENAVDTWASPAVSCVHGLCEDVVPGILSALPSNAPGLLYADPTTLLPVQTLMDASRTHHRMDILMHIPATTMKRVALAPTDPWKTRLRDVIEGVQRQHWFIRRVVGKFHWTFLLGTNQPNPKAYPAIGLYDLDSPEGQRQFDKAHYSVKELAALPARDGEQLCLF